MEDQPVNIHDLLCRALNVQIEQGLGEMIINPQATMSVDTNEGSEILMENHDDKYTNLTTNFDDPIGVAQYDSLDEHHQDICQCQLCPLGKTRTKFVYGTGNPSADLMFVGEAPGRDEDLQGEPFVGRAGRLLNDIIKAMKFTREEVYIANILKCRPPNNRDPQPDEMEKCFPFLKEQIRLVKPKIICALGRIGAQALLNTSTPLGRLRKEWHRVEGIPTLVTYHPAALLRFPKYKKDTWEDMQLIMVELK
ncbi:MAG: uracil-DNA glycosylase, partial [bacterium]